MKVPAMVYYPPFNITRVSHTVFGVRDLRASKISTRRSLGSS